MKIVLFILINIFVSYTFANEFHYNIKQADTLHTATVFIDDFEKPKHINYQGLYNQKWVLNSALTTQKWEFKNVSQNTMLNVTKSKDQLIYSGQYRGKDLNYIFNLSENIWLQYIDVYFPIELYKNGLRKITYIRSRDLKPIILSIKEIQQSDPKYRSFKLYISPFPTFLWSIDYLVNAQSGLVIKKRVSGSPTLFMILKNDN